MATFPHHEAVLEHYGRPGDRILSLEPLGGDGINSTNFRLVFASRPGEPLHLKVLRDPEPRVAVQLEAFDRVGRAGVKVAEIVPPAAGRLAVETDGGRTRLVVFRYYPGQAGNCAKAPDQAVAAARELGRLNRALAATGLHITRSSRYEPLTATERVAVKAGAARGAMGGQGDRDRDRRVLAGLDHWARLWVRVELRRLPGEALEYVDYHPANVIFDGGAVAAILDFQSLGDQPVGQGLAFACSRFAETPEGMVDFVRAYEDQAGPLSVGRTERLIDLVRRETLCRIHYVVRSSYFHADDAWAFTLERHEATLDRLDRLENAFLERLAQAGSPGRRP
ncbi:MAG: hypothetical protein IMZ65_01040 [Planctomycetes bacterium]|nr:hypothetical protein [Planctomycetota bacterium]